MLCIEHVAHSNILEYVNDDRRSSKTHRPRPEGGTRVEIAIIGLGRMGANMAQRLLNGGHRVIAHNRSRGPIDEAAAAGAVPAYTLEDVGKQLAAPPVARLLVPAGKPAAEQIHP